MPILFSFPVFASVNKRPRAITNVQQVTEDVSKRPSCCFTFALNDFSTSFLRQQITLFSSYCIKKINKTHRTIQFSRNLQRFNDDKFSEIKLGLKQ